MKLLMICDFSAEEVRQKLNLLNNFWEGYIYSLFKKKIEVVDHGLWNYYAIQELNKYDDIDLTVISFHQFLKNKLQIINIGPAKCYFIQMNKSTILSKIQNKLFGSTRQEDKNLLLIGKLIKEINPDIVHVIGAETRFYSESILQVPESIPTIVQLQTLMSDPDFVASYPELAFRIPSEHRVIARADYIGTKHKKYAKIVKQQIKKDAIILETQLAVAEPVDFSEAPKEFDFVYFSANINKACDLAIEAFALSKKKHPEITIDIVGYYDTVFKQKIDQRIEELHLEKSVTFEGRQITHDDVMRQIKKSKFALIPVKTDILCCTMREAMAKGLPLITTITPGTPLLNEKRESVLLSEVGDVEAMANNMNKLIENPDFANQLRENALKSYMEIFSNEATIAKWVDCYKVCIEHHNNGTPIPDAYQTTC